MLYDYVKALHLIFVVTWFAGLFYIVRLFVYQVEASEKPLPERNILGRQLKLMARRLWRLIARPSMVLALGFGIWMLLLHPHHLADTWMQVKLGLVMLLVVYHFLCDRYFKQLQNDEVKHSSRFFRIFNEGATLLLFAIVFPAVLKNAVHWPAIAVVLAVLAVLIFVGYKVYAHRRKTGDRRQGTGNW